jgi:type IV pilus assembly protein PilC
VQQASRLFKAKIRRQGITNTKVKKVRFKSGSKITEKDIALFTRQLATMMKSGVPLLQAFDIVGRGHSNPTVGKLLLDIKADVETGSSLSQAFRKFPLQFDALYCNLVAAGEQAGILDTLAGQIGDLQRKNHRHQEQDQVSDVLPNSILVVAFVITAIIMIFVIPAFKEVFKSFGADFPAPTLIVMAISDFFVCLLVG